MTFLLFNVLNGIQLSMLMFLMALGLTLIFGLMDILNLAHGAFYMIGAYAGYVLFGISNSFWVALVLAPLLPAVVGFLLQYFVMQPLIDRGRSAHLDMALLTFGIMFFTIGAIDLVFFERLGLTFLSIGKPEFLNSYVNVGMPYPSYRLFIVGLGLGIGVLVWLALERTVIGAVVRAGVDDREMVSAMGINIHLVFALVFAAGCGLAGMAGVVAGAELSIDVNMGVQILIPTLVVVVLGGLGSVKGCFFGALIVGLTETMAQAYAPDLALFAIYVLLVGILVFRPHGFFGRTPRTV